MKTCLWDTRHLAPTDSYHFLPDQLLPTRFLGGRCALTGDPLPPGGLGFGALPTLTPAIRTWMPPLAPNSSDHNVWSRLTGPLLVSRESDALHPPRSSLCSVACNDRHMDVQLATIHYCTVFRREALVDHVLETQHHPNPFCVKQRWRWCGFCSLNLRDKSTSASTNPRISTFLSHVGAQGGEGCSCGEVTSRPVLAPPVWRPFPVVTAQGQNRFRSTPLEQVANLGPLCLILTKFLLVSKICMLCQILGKCAFGLSGDIV